MLVTLVAILCNGGVCWDRVVTDSAMSGLSMTACAIQGQLIINDLLKDDITRGIKVQSYHCVWGKPARGA